MITISDKQGKFWNSLLIIKFHVLIDEANQQN